jgi:hypothetical protein
MSIDQVDRTVVTQTPTATAGQETVRTDIHRTSTRVPGGPEIAQRVIVLVFGLIQILIGTRIVLLLLDARPANDLVAVVLNVSHVFVAPFEGIVGAAVAASGATLDVSAILALVGWTMLEVIMIWTVRIFRREHA